VKRKLKRAADRSREPLSPQTFGERIRLALFGHKVREIAKAVGVSQSAIYNWISGANEPNLTKLSAFATATQVSIQWLITGAGEMRQSSRAFESALGVPYLFSAESQADAAARRELILARGGGGGNFRDAEINALAVELLRLTARVQSLEAERRIKKR
jgi:transcriptional regulator with XRE-family HTH domain